MRPLILTALSLLASVVCVSSSSIPHSYTVHERRDSSAAASRRWTKRSAAPQDAVLPVRIALAPQHDVEAAAHEHLMDMADPSSANFGKHWTAQQVHDFFAPDPAHVGAVREWLDDAGIDAGRHSVATGRGGGHVLFDAGVDEIEKLFRTEYHLWEHPETGALRVSCDEYHVPDHVKHLIDYVTPGVVLGTPVQSNHRKRRQSLRKRDDLSKNDLDRRAATTTMTAASSDPSPSSYNWTDCSMNVTPECIRALYGVPLPSSDTIEGNGVGLYESQDTYDQADLDGFFTLHTSPSIPNGTHPILQGIDGGFAPGNRSDDSGTVTPVGTESPLDIQMIYPLVYPQQQIRLYQTYDAYSAALTEADGGLFNGFLDALDASYCSSGGGDDPKYDPTFPDGHGWNQSAQCGVYQPANVISFSYEVAEADYSPAYLRRQCNEFMKLGLQGTSFIFSSGDFGTISEPGGICDPDDGRLKPEFPSTCPYVTSVGATQIYANITDAHPEGAVSVGAEPEPHTFTSGGGFSEVFARPSYQDGAVQGFLNNSNSNLLPPSSSYNASGRAYPDVAAVGYEMATFTNGFPSLIYGTSASAPIFAAVVARLNAERAAVGKGPVGFLNPLLYAHPDMFNDVTFGQNVGCHYNSSFFCSEGWDPVTGLGTPNYPAMRDVFLALP